MLPYLAQGANSAVEDGAVLGLLLGYIQSKNQLPKALNMYEELRKSRGEAIVRETFKQVRNSSKHNIDLLFPNVPIARVFSYARWTRSRGSRQDFPVPVGR